MAGEKDLALQVDQEEWRGTFERLPEHACACMVPRDRDTCRTLAG